MKKRGVLFLSLAVLLCFSPACNKQTDTPPVVTEAETIVVGFSAEEETEGKVKELASLQAESLPNNKAEKGKTFSLHISQNYGVELLNKEEVLLKPKMSVLDGLYSVCEDQVEMAFGGSFVKGIGNLRAENKGFGKLNQDWFFFVNGIFADRGAIDYLPQAGEKVWWDYHPWQMFQATTAVIGCYPEPFLHGYQGVTKETTILYCPGEKELAQQLASALKTEGVAKITIAPITNELLLKREGPTLVVGEWNVLKANKYLADWNQAFLKNGNFIHFREERLELLDYTGTMARELTKEAGVITALGEFAGDACPLWLICGLDQEGLRNTVSLLVERFTCIAGFFSAAVFSDEVIRLPLMP